MPREHWVLLHASDKHDVCRPAGIDAVVTLFAHNNFLSVFNSAWQGNFKRMALSLQALPSAHSTQQIRVEHRALTAASIARHLDTLNTK